MTATSEPQTQTQTGAAEANAPDSSAAATVDEAVATAAQTSPAAVVSGSMVTVCGSSYSNAAENVCTNPTCGNRGVEVSSCIAASVSYGISILNDCLSLPPNTGMRYKSGLLLCSSG